MILGIHHIAVAVHDLDRASRFHQAAAGLMEMPDLFADAVRPTNVRDSRLLAGRNGFVELLKAHGGPVAKPPPVHQPGIRHFCIQNHDCARLELAVTGADGSTIAPPLDLGTGNQYAYVRDPEGNIIEIEGLPFAPADEPTWLAHVAIVTRDFEAMIAFYGALGGEGVKARGQFGPGRQFDTMAGLTNTRFEGAWLWAGNMQFELWKFHEPVFEEADDRELPAPGYVHIGLQTDDLEADRRQIADCGGEVIEEPVQRDGAKVCTMSDPEGNRIQLIEVHDVNSALSLASLPALDVSPRIEARWASR